MSLALYLSRVRSNDLLDRTTLLRRHGIGCLVTPYDVPTRRQDLSLNRSGQLFNFDISTRKSIGAPLASNGAKRQVVDLRGQ